MQIVLRFLFCTVLGVVVAKQQLIAILCHHAGGYVTERRVAAARIGQ